MKKEVRWLCYRTSLMGAHADQYVIDADPAIVGLSGRHSAPFRPSVAMR